MKKTKLTKKTKKILFLIKWLLIGLGAVMIINLIIAGVSNLHDFTQRPLERMGIISPVSADVTYVRKPKIREYAYNESVPESVILIEVKSLAERFNLIEENWIKILRCEATCTKQASIDHNCVPGELDNLAQNPGSTAVGLGQYLIRTWYATGSWKNEKKARTDYKASLFEMALDLDNGEQNKWTECLEETGVYKFKK